MYEVLNVIFTLVIVGGLLWAYVAYISEKGDKLKVIETGICPKCKEMTMELTNQKGGGCSGTKEVTYRCSNCGYEDSFNIDGGSCGSGSCRL